MAVHIEADLTRLPSNLMGRIRKALVRLERWPNVSGAKPLSGNWAGHRSLRIGAWRIIFQVRGSDVIVVRIAPREEVYDD